MKFRYLILLLFTFFSLSASAQRFHGGILGGINATQIDGDFWAGYYKMGLNFGAFVNTNFSELWSGQLEIKYSGKGSSSSIYTPNPLMISLRYIDVPVLAVYHIKKIQLQTGISINYLFDARYYDGDWFNDWDIEPKKFETSIVAGINYNMLKRLDLNVRFGYSLFPVRSKFITSDWGEGAWYNNVLSFAFYYKIGN